MTLFDTSFDSKLSSLEGLNRLPWIGNGYSQSPIRMLILGESAYDWHKNDDSSIDAISKSIGSVSLIFLAFSPFKIRGRPFANFKPKRRPFSYAAE